MSSTLGAVLQRASRSYVLVVAIGLVIGLTLAPVAFQATQSDGKVAVVPLSGGITGGTSASVGAMLEQAREDPDVKAVVIVSNSGGGSASASEELYLESKRTAEQMPVVAYVDAAALSGAYYTVAPADTIYTKPASFVGSVGTLSPAPSTVEPNSLVITSGSNKLTGADTREFYRMIETVSNAFYNAVEDGRDGRLELSRSELAQARIYTGTQAVENGLADQIGGQRAAVKAAAEQAGMEDYDVTFLRPDREAIFLSRNNFLASDAPEKRMVSSEYFLDPDGSSPALLMMPGSYVAEADERDQTLVLSGGRESPPVNASLDTTAAAREVSA